MDLLSPVIFPNLRGKIFVRVDIAAEADAFIPANGTSPFLNVDYKHIFMKELRRSKNADYLWGGYLEDRSRLWQGSYMDPKTSVHLGIDVDVPAGTPVTVAHPATVVNVVHDLDQDNGWGGVVFFELDKPLGRITHYLYGHLARETCVKQGDHAVPGDIVGILGVAAENGGWSEHLHVQALTTEAWEMCKGDLTLFDGYGARPTGAKHPLFPNPKILL